MPGDAVGTSSHGRADHGLVGARGVLRTLHVFGVKTVCDEALSGGERSCAFEHRSILAYGASVVNAQQSVVNAQHFGARGGRHAVMRIILVKISRF